MKKSDLFLLVLSVGLIYYSFEKHKDKGPDTSHDTEVVQTEQKKPATPAAAPSPANPSAHAPAIIPAKMEEPLTEGELQSSTIDINIGDDGKVRVIFHQKGQAKPVPGFFSAIKVENVSDLAQMQDKVNGLLMDKIRATTNKITLSQLNSMQNQVFQEFMRSPDVQEFLRRQQENNVSNQNQDRDHQEQRDLNGLRDQIQQAAQQNNNDQQNVQNPPSQEDMDRQRQEQEERERQQADQQRLLEQQNNLMVKDPNQPPQPNEQNNQQPQQNPDPQQQGNQNPQVDPNQQQPDPQQQEMLRQQQLEEQQRNQQNQDQQQQYNNQNQQ